MRENIGDEATAVANGRNRLDRFWFDSLPALAKHLALSVTSEDETLRLSPQDDMAAQSRGQGKGEANKRRSILGSILVSLVLFVPQIVFSAETTYKIRIGFPSL